MTIQNQAITYSYVAPETIKSNIGDKKSDIFSLGSTIWEICAHKVPFMLECQNVAQIILAVQSMNMPAISEDWNPIAKQLIRMCWKENPNERPTTYELLKFIVEAVGNDKETLLSWFENVCCCIKTNVSISIQNCYRCCNCK